MSLFFCYSSCWILLKLFHQAFFFYILNQFSIIDNHIKPTQKKSYVTFANELFGSFDIIKNMRVACWGAQRWQLCQTINEQRKEIITNSFPLSCGNPFIFIEVGVFLLFLFFGFTTHQISAKNRIDPDVLLAQQSIIADTHKMAKKAKAGFCLNLNTSICSIMINGVKYCMIKKVT